MRRLIWVAVGAAGGIWAYRRAQGMAEQAREQGLVLTAHQAGTSAAAAVATAKSVATASVAQVRELQAAPQQVGAAAASVLRRREQGEQ